MVSNKLMYVFNSLIAAPYHGANVLEFRFCRHFSVALTSTKNWTHFCCLYATTSLNLQVHSTTVIEQHTAHISYNGQGKNQHLDLSHVIYQSNETGDYGSFFVSNA